MRVVSIVLNLVCAVLISAHFLRGGHLAAAIFCLLVPLLFFRRQKSSLRGMQCFALGAATVWVHTVFQLVAARMALGQAWYSAALILGGVAMASLLAAALLNHPAIRRFYP